MSKAAIRGLSATKLIASSVATPTIKSIDSERIASPVALEPENSGSRMYWPSIPSNNITGKAKAAAEQLRAGCW